MDSEEGSVKLKFDIRIPKGHSRGGAAGQMAERRDGRKQETPEKGVERWIMMMKEEEEWGRGNYWTASRSKQIQQRSCRE